MKFTKIHGLGNDYLYINCAKNGEVVNESKIPQLARYMSNRNFGAGADGIILIEDSEIADFKMRIYNSDGSQAEMCGNGIRGVGKFVYDYNLTNKTNITIETLAGIKKLRLFLKNNKVESVEVNMGKTSLDTKLILTPNMQIKDSSKITTLKFNIENTEYIGNCISIGNPHFVIFTNQIDNIDVEKVGKFIENSKYFLNKTNVEFAQVIDRRTIKMRVWERGVGETYACGTGACCVAKVANLYGYVRENVNVMLKGGVLNIKINKETDEIFMTGISTKVYDGELEKAYL